MSTRSLNKVMLIGNLTRDPELRYTPQGTAVCTMGLATNRSWTTESGEKREETEFHRIVAWNKLAELCSQLLFKGRRIYVEGRLSTRSWTGTDGQQRQATEVVIDDMVILDSKRAEDNAGNYQQGEDMGMPDVPAMSADDSSSSPSASNPKPTKAKSEPKAKSESSTDEAPVDPEDIPF